MFKNLKNIIEKPELWSNPNPTELWNNPHISKQMLDLHLNPDVDPASRNKTFVDQSIDWIINKFKLNSESKILDLGCGPGIYTLEFAKTGANVTGNDVSTNSINYAKKNCYR